MTKNSPFSVMGGIVGFLSVLGLLGFLGLFIHFQAALNQEEDTAEVLKAILVMELSRSNAVAVSSNPNHSVTRNFATLRSHLEKQGWTWKDQLGGHVLYEKANQRLDGDRHQFSSTYAICTLHPQ